MEEFERIDGGFDAGPRSGLSQLQAKYVIPFAGAVFVAILLVGLVLSIRSRDILREQVKQEQLSSARAGAQAVGAAIQGTAQIMDGLAKSETTRGGNFSSIKSRFETLAENVPVLDSLFLFTTSSRLITASSINQDMARLVAEDPCFDRVRAGASSCYSRMYRFEEGRRRSFVFMPVFDDSGKAARVLAGGIDLDSEAIRSIVLEINPGKKGFSFLVDSNGALVLSGDPEKEGAQLNVNEYDVVKEVLEDKRGSLVYRYGRVPMMASFYPVDPSGWGLVVQRPLKETGAGTGVLYKLMLVFLLVGTAAATALAIMQAQAITRFLFTLGNRMDAVSAGKRGQRISKDENCGLDQLTESFNRMVKMIEKDWARGSRELEDVRKTAQYNAGLLSSIQDLFLVTDPRMNVVMINEKAEVYVPAGSRPATGKPMGDLGHAWGQKRLREAALKAMQTDEVASLSNIRFTTPDGADTAIFDFRVYPVSSDPAGVFFYGREVSEFVARHEKVQNSELFFREMSTDLGDPVVVINSDHKVEWFNPAANRVLHIEDDFLGSRWFDMITSESRDIMQGILDNAPDDGTPQVPGEVDIEIPNRRVKIEVSAGKMNIGGHSKFVLSFRMVPPARGREREALQNKPRLENRIKFLTAVIESIPEVLAIVGGDGRLMMVNSAFAEMFKERKEVFIGKKLDVLHAEQGPMVDLPSVARDGVSQRETTVKNLKGEKFKASVISTAVNNGTHGGYLVTVRETETEHRTRVYEKRVVESRTRTRMAKSIAGRFESINETLLSALRDLGDNIFADDTRAMWGRAMRACKELTFSINSLYMYSMDSAVKLIACNVPEIIDNTIEELGKRGMIPGNVVVDTAFQDNIPPLNADADQLKMALWHLIHNAAEAVGGREDGGEILIRSYSSDVDRVQAVVVEVLDNGPEYDTGDADRFFEPFYGNKPGGIGLGLTLARRAIIRHNGRVGIQRAENVTRASFYIPLNLTPENISRAESYAR